MADTDDALKHFINSNDDPYTLLDLPSGTASTDKEIRSAWKKTALKFHPDKIRAKDDIDEATANRLYILRQDAYGILSEPHLKEQYDNALRAKEQKRQRDAAFTGKRKAMKEDLEKRENAAKRQKVELDDEDKELERLRLDGQRRRRERAEMLRRQAEEEERAAQREQDEGIDGHENVKTNGSAPPQVQDIDRVIKLRFPQGERTTHLSKGRVEQMLSRFGSIEAVTLKERKVKIEGEKHRRPFVTVAVIFESIVGAHAAVSDFAGIAQDEQGDWQLLERPEWASGHEPPSISQRQSDQPQKPSQSTNTAPATTQSTANGDADDILMIRLKNAEKKRREDKKRKEEEEDVAANGAASSSPPQRMAPTFASFKAKAAAVPSSDDAERKREAERRRLEEEMRREEEDEERQAAGSDVVAA